MSYAPASISDKTYFGMFTDEGNAAVKEAIDDLTKDQLSLPWNHICLTLYALPFNEAGDTAVRDEVFEYLGKRGLVSDVKTVATRPHQYPDPLPSAT